MDSILSWDEINPRQPRIIFQPHRNAPQPEPHIPAVHQPDKVNHKDNGDDHQVIKPD